jgi:LacI family transcriptional regulator
MSERFRPDPARRVTMQTIAELAGVNASTVSRVLSKGDIPENALTPTSRRIRDIARELGYVPDPHAASLRTQRTRALGVLVPRMTDVVLAAVCEVIEETATELGYQTVVSNTWDDQEQRRRKVELLLGHRVDGLILGDALLEDPFLDELAERQVPFVLVSRRSGGHASVTCDDFLGGRLAGTHLADLGHRRIAILAGPPHASTGRDRTSGCLQALAERGITVQDRYIVPSPHDARGGHAAAELPVPLTSVRSDHQAMGAAAAQMLITALSGRTVVSQRLPPQLVVRRSSDSTVRSRTTRR